VPPGIADATTPNPLFNLTPAATVDEGNNWINMAFGPLSLVNNTLTTLPGTTPAAPQQALGNYSISTGSSAIDHGNNSGAPNHDFFGTSRPQNTTVDIGAVEFTGAAAAPVASVTGGPLAFGNVATGTSSTAQVLTLHNTGNATLTGITYTFTAGYTRATAAQGGAGTCGAAPATLTTVAGTCTIRVVFTPAAAGASTGSLTIAANVAVTGSPVALSGTGVAPVVAAALTPTTRNFGTVTRNCPGTTPAQILACALDPAQVFTLTNTGNVTLTGIGHGTLAGTNVGAFAYRPALSTCGAATGTQLVGNTTLAPGATCVVTVQFQPQTGQATGVKNATISVTDGAGTQTSTLTGTAN